MTRARLLPVPFVLCLLSLGCGEKGPPEGPPLGKPAPLHGHIVLADGTPLRGGLITFTPVEVESGGKVRYEATGLIDAQGNYKAGLSGDGAGAVPGEYKVRIAPRDYAELPKSNSDRIPQTYRTLVSTPLVTKVEDKDNSFNVTLK